jgi:hypothetical protein
MVADYFNLGFTVHKSKLFNSDEDVTFPPLPTEEHFDATRLQQRWDKIASEYRSLVLMEQSIDQQVTKRTHIGEKRDQETILSEVMAEISEARNKFKFSKDMEVSGMSRRAFLTPPPRLNFATVTTISLGSASDGSSPASVEPSVASNNTSLLLSPRSAANSGNNSSGSSAPATPLKKASDADTSSSNVSPGRSKVLGRLGGGRSGPSMQSRHQRQLGGDSWQKSFVAAQEKQHKERLENSKEMQRMQNETMLKMQAMNNEHQMQMQMQMITALGAIFGGSGGFGGGGGSRGGFGGGFGGGVAGGGEVSHSENSVDSDGLLGP